MRGQEGKIISLPAAGSSDAFELKGGVFMLSCVGTFGGGSATLQTLGPDGTTWITAAAAITAAGTAIASLGAGQYRVTTVTATDIYFGISRVPGE